MRADPAGGGTSPRARSLDETFRTAPRRLRPLPLVGRRLERRALDRLLTSAHEGKSGTMVIRGEAGVGKTALLDYCAGHAAGFRVVRIAGVECEMELPFAALHQLCTPLLDRLAGVPLPQQHALSVALGTSFGDAPDRFLVALAVLGLTAEVGAEEPLLCLVDDAQWLDTASAEILSFVARRLLAESVVMIFAAADHPNPGALADLPEFIIKGLPPADARALLEIAVITPLDPGVRDRLIAETGGNPLALIELASAMAANPGPAGFSLVDDELSSRIEQSFLKRLEGLDDDVRRLLVIAAAEPGGDPVLLRSAARRLGIDLDDVPPKLRSLVTVGERVAFAHPLVRSAVYGTASPEERREAHLVLASVTDARADRDRRAWHLAAASREPDEEVAAELERSAERAQARAGFPAAAAFLHRSVELTVDPTRRTARAFAAARASLHAGAFDKAREALVAAETGPLDALEGARVELARGRIAFAEGSAAVASDRLSQAARRLETLDLALARETYLGACGAAMFAGPARAQELVDVGRAVFALPALASGPRALDVLLDGLALLVTEGRGAAAPMLLKATRAFADDDLPVEDGLRWGWMATAASNALWDDHGLYAVCQRQIGLARRVGALEHLPIYLIALGTGSARAGDFATASSLGAEADSVAELTRTRLAPLAAELLLASLRGNEAEVSVLTCAAIEQAATSGQGMPATVADLSQAIVYNGLGRYDQALDAARRASATAGDLFAAMWALPEMVEAATRAGEPAVARETFARLVETTRPAATDYGLGIEVRSRALLVESREADALYREAIDRLGRTHMRSELARAHLLYGESLRRSGRRRSAREQLRSAHDMLSEMGMAAFAERARLELLATGEKTRRRAPDSRDRLTAQEAHVAGMARDGLSNTEIGARLFLSPRTVEWHLGNVFRKLGVTSRRELRATTPAVHGHPETEPAVRQPESAPKRPLRPPA